MPSHPSAVVIREAGLRDSPLIGQGITVTKSLLYSFVIAIALPVGPLLAMLYADKVQRKWLIVGAALAVIVFGLLFSQMKGVLSLIVLGVLIGIAGQTISVCYHAYQSELFPIGVRCRANGLVYSASRAGAMMSGFLIAFLLRDFGVVGVFAGVTVCMLIVAIAIGVFGPRTNGLRHRHGSAAGMRVSTCVSNRRSQPFQTTVSDLRRNR